MILTESLSLKTVTGNLFEGEGGDFLSAQDITEPH